MRCTCDSIECLLRVHSTTFVPTFVHAVFHESPSSGTPFQSIRSNVLNAHCSLLWENANTQMNVFGNIGAGNPDRIIERLIDSINACAHKHRMQVSVCCSCGIVFDCHRSTTYLLSSRSTIRRTNTDIYDFIQRRAAVMCDECVCTLSID